MTPRKILLFVAPGILMLGTCFLFTGIEHWLAGFGSNTAAQQTLCRIGIALPYILAGGVGIVFLFGARGSTAIRQAGSGVGLPSRGSRAWRCKIEAPASAASIDWWAISSGVKGRASDMVGVWMPPVTAQVMMTFLLRSDMCMIQCCQLRTAPARWPVTGSGWRMVSSGGVSCGSRSVGKSVQPQRASARPQRPRRETTMTAMATRPSTSRRASPCSPRTPTCSACARSPKA